MKSGEQVSRKVDVAILGAGTAGMAAYRAATKRGKDVLLIESGPYGTTCARVGCMPSKLLIAAAEAVHHARHAGPFGVTATVTVDGRAVMERVRSERDRFVGFVLESIESFRQDQMLRGHARFAGVDPATKAIDLEVTLPPQERPEKIHITARTVVIATGSSPYIPPVFDRIRDRLVVNDDVFSWDTLPESIAVFGAGVIGLELGQALSRLGVRVRVFGRGNTVGGLADPVVKETFAEILKAELDVDFDANVKSIEPKDASDPASGVVVRFVDADGNERTEHFTTALIAAGRRPNVATLCLENAGIDASSTVDRHTLQWGSSPIFVAGDVTDDVPLLHEAADEGTIAGDNAALYPEPRRGHRRSGLAIAFTDPPIAMIGGGFSAASDHETPYVVGEVSFKNQGRSRVMLQNRGVARLYADPKTRRFLGAEIAGPRAEHLAHLLAWAHQMELTVDQMLAMPFYHPVVEEGLRTALRDLASKLEPRPSAS